MIMMSGLVTRRVASIIDGLVNSDGTQVLSQR